MKNECNIIRDLLPLYMDGIVSEDTVSFVEEHLETCEACCTELEKMKAQNALETATSVTQVSDEKPLQVFAKKMNRKKRIVITSFVVILLAITLLGGCFLSYLKFHTPNLFSAASGFVQVTITDKEYVEIQQSPKVIIAKPGDAIFVAYMESRGFIEVEEERLGARRVFTNGEEKEAIFYSQNGYFSKWIWE